MSLPEPCIDFIGRIDHGGYGWVGYRSAHRTAYEDAKGPIPDGLQIDHLCRNRRCVNPAHLEAVTPAENTRRGLKTKLTLDQAREIRASTKTCRALAAEYGIGPMQVSRIKRGHRWKESVPA